MDFSCDLVIGLSWIKGR